MKLLLDSHVFLWWQMASPRLPASMVRIIAEADVVHISAATAWELGIKAAMGKLRLPEAVEDGILSAGFVELPVTFSHTRRAASLPPHHRDPFDRMLVAQTMCEGLTLMTHDDALTRYDVAVLRVP